MRWNVIFKFIFAESLPAYIMAHTSWFYVLDLMASLVLLALACTEPPAINMLEVMQFLTRIKIEKFKKTLSFAFSPATLRSSRVVRTWSISNYRIRSSSKT